MKTLISTTNTISSSAKIQIEHNLILSKIDGKIIFYYEFINIIVVNL
jgi:hypothetical protein